MVEHEGSHVAGGNGGAGGGDKPAADYSELEPEDYGLGKSLGGVGDIALRPDVLVHGGLEHYAQVAVVFSHRLVVTVGPLCDRGEILAVDVDYAHVGASLLGVLGEGFERGGAVEAHLVRPFVVRALDGGLHAGRELGGVGCCGLVVGAAGCHRWEAAAFGKDGGITSWRSTTPPYIPPKLITLAYTRLHATADATAVAAADADSRRRRQQWLRPWRVVWGRWW